jgi:hypothetical protein
MADDVLMLVALVWFVWAIRAEAKRHDKDGEKRKGKR